MSLINTILATSTGKAANLSVSPLRRSSSSSSAEQAMGTVQSGSYRSQVSRIEEDFRRKVQNLAPPPVAGLAATLHFPLVTGITAGIKTAAYTYPQQSVPTKPSLTAAASKACSSGPRSPKLKSVLCRIRGGGLLGIGKGLKVSRPVP